MGCETQKKSAAKIKAAMDSWLGNTKQQVIMGNGLPLKTGSDGAGGEVLLYGQQFYFRDAYSGNRVVWAYKMFFINPQDKVYHWITQRSEVPPQQFEISMYIR